MILIEKKQQQLKESIITKAINRSLARFKQNCLYDISRDDDEDEDEDETIFESSTIIDLNYDHPFDKTSMISKHSLRIEGKTSSSSSTTTTTTTRSRTSKLSRINPPRNSISSNYIINDKHQQVTTIIMKRDEEKQEEEEERRRRRRRRQPPNGSSSILLLSICMISYIVGVNLCNCDKTTTTTTTVKTMDAKLNPTNHRAPLPETSRKSHPLAALPPGIKQQQATVDTSKPKGKSTPSANAVSSHKDPSQLLNSLNESIERQHFRINPIRSFVQQRPSKFDSGYESLKELSDTNHATTSQQVASQQQHPKKARPSKADDGLKHIMAMHEHAASNHQVSTIVKAKNSVSGHQDKPEPMNKLNRLRYIATHSHSQLQQQPVVAQPVPSLVQSNRIVSQALSYLVPLVKSTSPILERLLAQSQPYQPLSSSSSSSSVPSQLDNNYQNTSRLKSPFSARANTKISSLHALGKKLSSSSSSSLSSLSSLSNQPGGSMPSSPSTEPPKTSVLSRPNPSSLITNGHHENSLFSTPMSVLGSDNSKYPHSSSSYEAVNDLMADSSSPVGIGTDSLSLSSPSNIPTSSKSASSHGTRAGQDKNPSSGRLPVSSWLKNSANQMAQGYFQDSFRDLLTLSQLPILSGGPISTAPSDLEPGGRKWLANKAAVQQQQHQHQMAINANRSQTIDDILRYAYIFGSGVRRKRDPLKVLGPSKTLALVSQRPTSRLFRYRSNNHKQAGTNKSPLPLLASLPSSSHSHNHNHNNNNALQLVSLRDRLNSLLASNKNAKPRGVMWDVATDPSFAVTVFHLLERASVALPLGFLLMPFVHMIRNPLHGIPLHHGLNAMSLGRILPARASHRSVDYEELAKRLDMMDKILSRALRQTHREA